MTKENTKAKKGFTIIEVVLVLAIAGLIFLMVFVALPALQRSQRDTQRRDDMGRFISQLAQYQTNNNRKVPPTKTDWNDFIANYLSVDGVDSFVVPNGRSYTVEEVCKRNGSGKCSSNSTLNWESDKNKIYVYESARCDGENVTFINDSPNQIAIRYKFEGAGVYCENN